MNPIGLNLVRETILWYDIFSPENPDPELGMEELVEDKQAGTGPAVGLFSNFDYATLPNNEWQFYYYITIHLPNLVSVTSAFEYKFIADNFNWDQFFTLETIRPSFVKAVENCVTLFLEFCEDHGLARGTGLTQEGCLPDAGLIDQISSDVVDTYFRFYKINDMANYPAQVQIQLYRKRNQETYISLTLTFEVLLDILFFNNGFNRKHNREVFFKEVPELKFYTLWLKCSAMADRDVELTEMDTHFFLIGVACAVQIMLGEKGDLFIPSLEEKGFTEEARKIWFKTSAALLKIFREGDYGSVPGEEIDWTKLIR